VANGLILERLRKEHASDAVPGTELWLAAIRLVPGLSCLLLFLFVFLIWYRCNIHINIYIYILKD
jgi:hypothetical protein